MNAPFANGYTKPLNETQVNGTYSKRATANNITRAGQTGGGYMTNAYGGRQNTAGGGVKEALSY